MPRQREFSEALIRAIPETVHLPDPEIRRIMDAVIENVRYLASKTDSLIQEEVADVPLFPTDPPQAQTFTALEPSLPDQVGVGGGGTLITETVEWEYWLEIGYNANDPVQMLTHYGGVLTWVDAIEPNDEIDWTNISGWNAGQTQYRQHDSGTQKWVQYIPAIHLTHASDQDWNASRLGV